MTIETTTLSTETQFSSDVSVVVESIESSSMEMQISDVSVESIKLSHKRKVLGFTLAGLALVLLVQSFLVSLGNRIQSIHQDHRRLVVRERGPRLVSLGETGVITCHEILTARSSSSSRTSASRRTLRNTATKTDPSYYIPQQNPQQREDNWLTLEPELQRVDLILREAYTKDLVVDVTDEALATTSLYAAAYGWPTLTLQTTTTTTGTSSSSNPQEENVAVQSICESTSSASNHHVLSSAWASSTMMKNNNDNNSNKLTNFIPLDELPVFASSSSGLPPRIRLLHIAVQQGEWRVLQNAKKLLQEGRIEHVLISLHFTQQWEETEAVQVLTTLLASGYLPMDEKDRKKPLWDNNNRDTIMNNDSNSNNDPQHDAFELLRQMIQKHAGTSTQMWFYRNHLADEPNY